jgi:hypothetical protein
MTDVAKIAEGLKTNCGNCAAWEANGTPYGGKCWNPNAETHGITTSVFKENCGQHIKETT